MFAARKFKWLPNALTFSRLFLALPIFLLAVNEQWAWALLVLLLALSTDFLDGLAAKKLNAYSRFGEEVDPLADASLVAAGFLGLGFTGVLEWWIVATVLIAGGLLGLERFFAPKGTKLAAVLKMASVSALMAEWTAIAWIFAAQAFGWSWLYVVLTAIVLAIAASLKRHRLRAWAGISR